MPHFDNLHQGGYVFIGVCLLVGRITQKKQLDRYLKIRWKGGTWATEETSSVFCGNPDHIALALRLGYG